MSGATALLLASGGGTAPITLADYKLADGTMPAVLLDFVNGLYYVGSTPSTIGALLNGSPTTDANGLIMPGNNSISAKGALLTAFTTGTGTVAYVIDQGTQLRAQFPLTLGSDNNSPIYLECTQDPQKAINYQASGPHSINFNACDFTWRNFVATGWSATTPKRTAMFNDQTAVQDDFIYDLFSPVILGDLQAGSSGANSFNGRFRALAVYPTRQTAAQLPGVRALTPWQTTRRPGLFFPQSASNYALLPGTALKIERTVPWSFVCNFAVGHINAPNGQILFTNVTGTPYGGYEVWLQGSASGRSAGLVCVRVMADIAGGSAIDVYGSIPIADGKSHMVGVTYDGSSLAAGIKIWVDGVADGSVTVAQNNLTTSILTNSGQMWIGNQTPGTNTFSGALINFFAFSNIVRSAGYMAACTGYNARPALDANNTLYFDFSEGSGTTLTDKSSNGFNGAIAGSVWF